MLSVSRGNAAISTMTSRLLERNDVVRLLVKTIRSVARMVAVTLSLILRARTCVIHVPDETRDV